MRFRPDIGTFFVFQRVRVSAGGLSAAEVQAREAQHGTKPPRVSQFPAAPTRKSSAGLASDPAVHMVFALPRRKVLAGTVPIRRVDRSCIGTMMRRGDTWPFHAAVAGPCTGPAKAAAARRGMHRVARALTTAAILLAGPAAADDAVKLVVEDYRLRASDSGIELFVRNKRPADMAAHAAERTVLFVHGSTYPASTTFDLPLDGMSWMDFIAARGFDAYLMDLRGYGRSTRPQAMSKPPAEQEPIVTTGEAARDLAVVVDDILRQRRIAKLILIGWSWGTSIAASYAAQHPDKVERLVFYGPQWIVRDSPPGPSGKLGAYHTISREAARERWLAGAPQDKQADLIPAGWFERWADATFASDPVGAAQEPPVLRAPSGTVLDSQTYWRAGKPLYNPAHIKVPVLLVHGEWDRNTPQYMSEALLPLLKNARSKRHDVIPEATHMAMLEKNRMQLFDAVQRFLEEKPASDARAQPVAQASPPPSGGPDPSSRAAEPPPAPASEADGLVDRGKALLEQHDPAAARLLFERAAAQGHAGAMRGVAQTFDPLELQQRGVVGMAGDRDRAIEWYRRAAEAGDGGSLDRINRLSAADAAGASTGAASGSHTSR